MQLQGWYITTYRVLEFYNIYSTTYCITISAQFSTKKAAENPKYWCKNTNPNIVLHILLKHPTKRPLSNRIGLAEY